MSRLQHPDSTSYLAALRFRGGKTIIVEGPTDKRALARALHEFERERRVVRGDVVVDSVDTVGGFPPGLGNRERVEALHTTARAAGLETFAFTDREFRGFIANVAEFRDDIHAHHQPSSQCVWTRGHSIENYFFELEYVQDFLRYRFCDRLSSDMIDSLRPYWSQIVSQAAAYTVAARDMNALNRMSDALVVDSWALPTPGTIELVPSKVEDAALRRGLAAAEAAQLIALFQQLVGAARACCDAECCRWVAHGHLGDEAIWVAVGRVLLDKGADPGTVNDIAHGRGDEKAYYRADRWAHLHRGAAGGVTTPEPLWRAVGVTL